eukprot:gene11764-5543_t
MAAAPPHAVRGAKRLISIGAAASQEHKEAPAAGRAAEFRAALAFYAASRRADLYGSKQFAAAAKMMARGPPKAKAKI